MLLPGTVHLLPPPPHFLLFPSVVLAVCKVLASMCCSLATTWCVFFHLQNLQNDPQLGIPSWAARRTQQEIGSLNPCLARCALFISVVISTVNTESSTPRCADESTVDLHGLKKKERTRQIHSIFNIYLWQINEAPIFRGNVSLSTSW